MTEPKPQEQYRVRRDPRGPNGMTDLEASFLYHWRILAQDMQEPVRDYKFDDGRKWQFDFAWPDVKVAVECEGGIFTGQAHGSIRGILRDIEKYNAAQAQGWLVFRATSPMLRDDPAGFVEMVRAAIKQRTGGAMSTVWHIKVGEERWALVLGTVIRDEAQDGDTVIVDTEAKAELARRAAARLGKRLAVKVEGQ